MLAEPEEPGASGGGWLQALGQLFEGDVGSPQHASPKSKELGRRRAWEEAVAAAV